MPKNAKKYAQGDRCAKNNAGEGTRTPTVQPPDPKSGASANSATPAQSGTIPRLLLRGTAAPDPGRIRFSRPAAERTGVAGLEPTIRESKSRALPLGYTPSRIEPHGSRAAKRWMMGFEPMNAGATIRCVSLFTTPTIKRTVPGGTRTRDPRLRRPMLYPTELLAQRAGDGNRTHVTGLEGQSSTIELHPLGRLRQNRGEGT